MGGKKMLLNFSEWNRVVESNQINSDFNSVYKSAIFEQDDQVSLIPDWLGYTRDVMWRVDEGKTTVIFINSTPQLKVRSESSGIEGVSIIQIDFKGAECFQNQKFSGINSVGPKQLFAMSNEPWWLYGEEIFERAKRVSSQESNDNFVTQLVKEVEEKRRFTCKWNGTIFNAIRKAAGNPALATKPSNLPGEIGGNTVEWAKGQFLKVLWNSNARLKWTYISLDNLGIIDKAREDINKQIKLPKRVKLKDAGIKSSFYDIRTNIENSFKTNESIKIYEQEEYYENIVDESGKPIKLIKYNVIDELIPPGDDPSLTDEQEKKKKDYRDEGYLCVRKFLISSDPVHLGHWLILERELDEVVIKADRRTGKIRTWINTLKAKAEGALRTVIVPDDEMTLDAQVAIAQAEIDLHRLLKGKFPKEFYKKSDSISRKGLEEIRRLYDENEISEKNFKRFKAVLYEFDWELQRKEKEEGKSALDRFWDNLKGLGSDVYDGAVNSYEESKRILGDIKDGAVKTMDDAARYLTMAYNLGKEQIPGMKSVDWAIGELEKKSKQIGDNISQWTTDQLVNLAEDLLKPYEIAISLDKLKVEITELNNPWANVNTVTKVKVPTIIGKISGGVTVETRLKGKKADGIYVGINGDIGLEANIDLKTKKLKVNYKYFNISTNEEVNLSGIFKDSGLNQLFPYFKIEKSTMNFRWYLDKEFTDIEIYNMKYNLEKDLKDSIQKSLKKYDGYPLDSYLTGIPNEIS